jgi:DNA invertase Pin-like site-specific DNA recombinase
MLEYVREDDTIYVEEFSRLGRSTADLLSIVHRIEDAGAKFVSMKENFDTSTPAGRLQMTMMAAIAEFERAMILERQREGIAIAKQKGIYKGRKPIEHPKFNDVIRLWRNGNITAIEAMRKLDMKPSTFYRKVKKFEHTGN